MRPCRIRQEGRKIPGIHGKTQGLKPGQLKRIERIYRRRIPPDRIVSTELARTLTDLSSEIRRQIGLLVNRRGVIEYVTIGDARSIFLPDFKRMRAGRERFRGLRCIHTHLDGQPLSQDDLTDLAILRLDLMLCIGIDSDGNPGAVHYAHLLPRSEGTDTWYVSQPLDLAELNVDFSEMIHELEREFGRSLNLTDTPHDRDRAILVGVATAGPAASEESMEELEELAISSGVTVVDRIIQVRSSLDPRTLIGRGKLKDILIRALQMQVDVIIFDRNLSPAQVRTIADSTDLKIIDRTQLILDIFAQRALSNEGKIQVELAQLRYLLPRLVTKNTAMSRLTGGIGGRGPGETKLEINRRRVRDRITRLEGEIEVLSRGRQLRRRKRKRGGLPIISIIGYTNAGKSTLLNALTKSSTFVENRLFATLDPVSRRLRFPNERDVIITDTVGFIKDLPPDLMKAFRATLEELDDAGLLLHVIDAASPHIERHIAAVESILADLGLLGTTLIRVFNKEDLIDPSVCRNLCTRNNGVSICARNSGTLHKLLHTIEAVLWPAPGMSVDRESPI